MNNRPLISVITVVYNGEKFLQQTIDSVKNQSYSNIEYIIIDGGSTDNTIEIIRRNEHVVTKWISEPDNGLYDAMNKGVKIASGELVGTINSDDWYQPHAVSMIVKAYLEYPKKKIFHGDINCINNNNTIHVKKAKNSSFLITYYGMVLNHPSMFIHRDIYENHNYNIELTSVADYQFVLENYLINKTQFHYVPLIISNFRLGGISGSLSLVTSLKENYFARKNAGMNLFQRVFGVLVRLMIEVYKKII